MLEFGYNKLEIKEGCCTQPRNSRDAHWICPECYEDFKELFGWTLERGGK